MKHPIRIAAASLLVLGVVLTGMVVVQRSRSESEWEKVQAELSAKGLDTKWESLIPAPVPEHLNFYAHPVVRELLPAKGGPRPSSTNSAIAPVPLPSMYEYGSQFGYPFQMNALLALPRRSSEKSGTNTVSLEDLKQWAAGGEEAFASLREANQRPHARFDGDYRAPFNAPIPNFVVHRALAQLLGSTARVHLLLGDSAKALEHLETVKVVMRGMDSPPYTLVSAMIHTAIGGLYLEVVRDGLHHGLWGERELRLLADHLVQIRLLQSVHRSLRDGELAGVQQFFEDLAGPRNSPARQSALQTLGATQFTPNDIFVRAAPRSWIRRNQALHARLMLGFLDTMDGEKGRFYPAKSAAAGQAVSAAFAKWSPHTALAGMATPNFQKAGIVTTRNQIKIHQAALVCALTLHKKQQGAYPETLAALVPAYISKLPHDPFSGADYKYLRIADGFLLYSVGANEKDDGGLHGDSLSPSASEDFVWDSAPPKP